MISKLFIENFRSIKKSEIDFGKITVLTGENNSGKSSYLYALLTLKNFLYNPNQGMDAFFAYPPNTTGAINLGGFNQVVFHKDENLNIKVGVEISDSLKEIEFNYNITFGNSSVAHIMLKKPINYGIGFSINFPHNLQNKNMNLQRPEGDVTISWNSLNGQVVESPKSLQDNGVVDKINNILNYTPEQFKNIDFVPWRRGFLKQFFAIGSTTQIYNEDEIATILGKDRDLEGRVAHYLEKIIDKTFSVRFIAGTASFYLQLRDKKTGFVSDLVNEGFGVNQLVTILTKVLAANTNFICIDEPEIHLHPSYINRMVEAFVEIAVSENKQFLVSTHSEHFVTALMKCVAENQIKNDDAKVYYVKKDKKGTNIEYQPINEKGQIKGGLKNFYEAELDNLKTLFKISE